MWGALLLGGCPTAPANHDPVVQQLQVTAGQIHSSIGQLAILEQAAIPDEHTYAEPASGPLTTPLSLDWHGPIEPVVKMIARMIGYGFEAVGKPPFTPAIVALHAQRKPAFLVLEDAGWQAGGSVGIVVDERIHEIQIVYKGIHP